MNTATKIMPGDWKDWEGDLVGGEFPLEKFLGTGENGAVFRTRIPSGDTAAIKLVPARGAQAETLVERWSRASALDHPNLIRIVSTGTWTKGRLALAYVVTEYAEENLATVLAERPLTPDETLEMLRPVADALAFLHDRGFAHGRLKPSNVFAAQDTLKVSSDAVSVGDASSDLRAVAATVADALTQSSASREVNETDLLETLPRPFREIAENCAGHDGRPQWSAADLAGWLESQKDVNSAVVPGSKSKIKIPRGAYYLLALALIVGIAITIGVLRNRMTAPVSIAPALSTPLPAAQPPSTPSAALVPPTPSIPQQTVIHQVLPEISAKARRTIHGTVRVVVRVEVDSSGNVTQVALERSSSRYFGRLAVEAARKWRFIPAGTALREWSLRFGISRTRTDVVIAKSAHPRTR